MTLLSLTDQFALRRRQPRVLVGRAVEQPPDREPGEAEAAGHEEGRLPAVLEREEHDQRRRHHRAERRAAVEDRHAERALADREPLGDRLGRAGPVAGLAEAEHEAARRQRGDAARERVRHRRERPDRDRQHEAEPRADAVVDAARHALADGVREQEPRGDAAELRVAEAEVLRDDRREHRQRQAVDVVDQRGQEHEPDDPPAQAGELERGVRRNGLCSVGVVHCGDGR